MRIFLFLSLAVFFACTATNSNQSIPEESSRPNIIYILADDLGYGDIQAYNPDSKIPTPNLDKLAAGGMRFTDAHSPSAVCTPTRYGILTGQYSWRSGLPDGVLWSYGRLMIEPERMTVGKLLQQNGYHTAVVGKWHLGLDWALHSPEEEVLAVVGTQVTDGGVVKDMELKQVNFEESITAGPLDVGFDYSFILPASLDIPPYCYLENDKLMEIPTDSTQGNDLNTGSTGAFWRPGPMAPSFDFYQVLPTFTQKAQAYIQEQSKSEQPFFLYLPLAAPHTPWVPTNDYDGASQAGQYGDFVAMVDTEVGKILKTLDELNLAQNTLVIFTSDNGPYWKPKFIEQYQHRAAGNLRGMKADIWEGGHRVPFIVRWSGKIEPNSQSNALTTLTNLPATCAALLKVDLPNNSAEDSHSILPILFQQADTIVGQEAIVNHSSRGVFAIRKGVWKLILGTGSGGFSIPVTVELKDGDAPGQLYNLQADPSETENVYTKFPAKVEELTTLLETYKSSGHSR